MAASPSPSHTSIDPQAVARAQSMWKSFTKWSFMAGGFTVTVLALMATFLL